MLRTNKVFTYIMILSRALKWLLLLPRSQKLKKIWITYKHGGISLCWHFMVERFGARTLSYEPFRNQLSNSQSKYILEKCSYKPLFSIVVPVHILAGEWLEKCISSVVNQHYRKWELILVDDASHQEDLKQLMDKWASQDNRFRVYYLEENSGIAGATNFGIKQARGEFIGFLDHDDELSADALTWVVWTLSKHPEALWLYSDEDKVSIKNEYHTPYFKPDYSPEHLFSIMFTCHFSVYSAEIIRKVKGLREGFEGSQDHDLALRLSEIIPKDKVIHIPRILYHWREIPGSTAFKNSEKPLATINGRKAVAQALDRRFLKATVKSHPKSPTLYMVELKPLRFPKIIIVIPTKNCLPLLKKCIDSIRLHTDYPNYEIIIIDNNSDDPAFFEYIKNQELKHNIKVLKYPKPFNHSDMNNLAVASADSEFVVFINNDIEIISDNWLEQLVATAQMDNTIASVGALLIYPNGKVQHGGIILGLNGYAGHAHKDIDPESTGYFGRLHSIQEMSGITAALSLIRKSAFQTVGGFNVDRYPTSFNDVDLAIRLKQNGFRAIYNPMVKSIHYESLTRPVNELEILFQQRLKEDYGHILYKDPFYNPNLALNNEQFHGFRQFPVEEQIPELADMPKKHHA